MLRWRPAHGHCSKRGRQLDGARSGDSVVAEVVTVTAMAAGAFICARANSSVYDAYAPNASYGDDALRNGPGTLMISDSHRMAEPSRYSAPRRV